MDSYLLSQNFIHCKSDSNVYMLRNFDSMLIIVLYVDDPLIIGSSVSIIATVKTSLHDMLSIIDMGLLHYFLGLEIS
jgi:histone deacetylase 1/2